MLKTRCLRCTRAHHVFFASALLTVALAITPQASGSVAQARSTPFPTKGTTEKGKPHSLKITQAATRPRPSGSLHRDLLMHIEDGQKSLQRQLENLTGITERRTDGLQRHINILTGRLDGLASAQEQSTATQQLLTVSMRSMRLLLMIVLGLLLVVCGSLSFFLYQLKQFGGFRLTEHKQSNAAEAPTEAFEAEWKVSS
jgi:hypothetical protein